MAVDASSPAVLMARRPRLTPCGSPGCPELTADTYCPRHAKQGERRPSARDRGYDTRWQRVRRDFIRDNPVCQDPEGCLDRATDVDHLDGLGPRGPRGYDPDNLRALCHRHHSRRTARDQPGGWAAGMRDF